MNKVGYVLLAVIFILMILLCVWYVKTICNADIPMWLKLFLLK